MATKHFVEHDTETEDVAASIERFAAHLLGGHVGHRAHDGAGSAYQRFCRRLGVDHVRRLDYFCQTEIHHFGLPARRDDDVRGLDVAVDDSTCVRFCERVSHLRCDGERFFQFHRPATEF